MKRNTLVVGALLAGLVGSLASCKKDSAKSGGSSPSTNTPATLPAELTRKPAAVNAQKLVAPALFAYVPADTAFMVGSFEPVPLAYFEKIFTKIGPAMKGALDRFRDDAQAAQGGKSAVFDAILAELDGKWSVAGVESLGLTAQPHFVLYGIGLVPVVMRFEVKDDKAVMATVQRIAARAGETLPALETHDGKSFWRFVKKGVKTDTTFIVALLDNQLVAAFGPSPNVDAKLGLILGTEKPAQSMADGKALARVMTDHGYAPYFVGFLESKLFVDQLVALVNEDKGDDKPSAACVAEMQRIAGRGPRIVFGYHELTPTRQTMSLVVELAPDLLKELAALRTEVPGLGTALGNQPLMAMGGGIDFVAGQQFLIGAMTSWSKVYATCEFGKKKGKPDLGEEIAAVSRPLPPPLAKLTGGMLTVQDLAFGGSSPMPTKVDGFLLVAATDAKALYDMALQKQPSFGQLGITVDGKLHELPHDKLPIPFTVSVGVGDHALGAAVGDKGKELGERMMATQGGGVAPFLAMTYDYGRLIEMVTKVKRLQGNSDPTDDLNLALAQLFSRGSMTLDTSDKGLVFWASLDMK